jgi:hypothetical protein
MGNKQNSYTNNRITAIQTKVTVYSPGNKMANNIWPTSDGYVKRW